MKKREIYLMLLWNFFKFGCFTFGGGLSIVAQMQKVFANEKKLISDEELLDLTSVARSLPGTMIGNAAMMFGYRIAGATGGFICVAAMTLMPMIILCAVALFYTAFRDNMWIASAMNGVRSAVVPIIVSAALGMRKGAFRFPPCILVMLLSLALYLIFNLSCIYLVILGAVLGLIICEAYERKQRGSGK